MRGGPCLSLAAPQQCHNAGVIRTMELSSWKTFQLGFLKAFYKVAEQRRVRQDSHPGVKEKVLQINHWLKIAGEDLE